jgi:hypothetical protein
LDDVPSAVDLDQRVVSSPLFQPKLAGGLMGNPRSAFQQRVVEALIESKAINLEGVGEVMSKFGKEAALSGESLIIQINRFFMINCGNPGPLVDAGRIGAVSEQDREA